MLLCSALAVADRCQATEDWTQFRGSDTSGIADPSAKPPVKWDLGRDVLWQTEIPGEGWSSPVYDDRGMIWLTTAITEAASPEEIEKKLAGDPLARIKTVARSVQLLAICIDLDRGQIVHQIALARIDEPDVINPMNSYASPTPAISDGKVVCHFGSYGTWCLDEKSGELIWDRKFVVDHSVGPGSSPVIHDNQVLLVCDGMDKQFIAAVDLSTGTDVWQTNRPAMRSDNGEFRKAYCTPLLIDVAGSTQAVIPGAQWVAGYDPGTGKEIWRADHGDGYSVTPMAIHEAGMIVFSTGYGRTEFVAVDPTGSGDVSATHLKWRTRNAPTMPSFVARDGSIYAITDKGILNRLDARTGEIQQRQRIGGNFSASPLLAGGHLYLASREGVVSVVRCDEEMNVVSTNKFEGKILASPIVVGNDLIIRTSKKLYRISQDGITR
jgi:outer membrane protein assembly factor BamB